MEWANNRRGCGTAEGATVVHLPTKIKEYILQFHLKAKSKAGTK